MDNKEEYHIAQNRTQSSRSPFVQLSVVMK